MIPSIVASGIQPNGGKTWRSESSDRFGLLFSMTSVVSVIKNHSRTTEATEKPEIIPARSAWLAVPHASEAEKLQCARESHGRRRPRLPARRASELPGRR
jgi:hypothetical protein